MNGRRIVLVSGAAVLLLGVRATGQEVVTLDSGLTYQTMRGWEVTTYVADPCDPAFDALRDAYIEAGVVGAESREDAEHVAAASVAEVDILVSWNFRHIVHFDKISGYQGVNMIHGYRPVSIYSPKEVTEP